MPLIGCIADDFTGATDLASMLVRGGARTIQTIGIPARPLELADADALVVALKSRNLAPAEAVRQSLAALEWLREQGCQQFYFKYCSTFDSTAEGNIGPVSDALLQALGSDFTVACPSFPENRRSVFNGYLFANDVLLNESGMQDHPLTPMHDANLLRVLQPQTSHPVGLIDYRTLRAGVDATRQRIAALRDEGVGIAICDATDNHDLTVLGAACAELPLVTAGSGLALGMAQDWQARGLLQASGEASRLEPGWGRQAILSGSCSRATLAQIEQASALYPAFRIEAGELMARGDALVAEALAWAEQHQGPVLIYASSPPEEVRRVQQQFGTQQVGERIEAALAAVARGLVEQQGIGQLLVAGGETSGAVVGALGIEGLRIGASIDPGVPWTQTLGQSGKPLALALKSGNFGSADFMIKAWEKLA
ncbi:four-carbon acid sugar kinase family protein [Pseudomonas seleniipraecipitans]|uniref:3-oxo-tetronate kinase n=1 Tax=Phytopseudomonas seleniipraecipitans TaxID=640205 RepID=A0ABY5J6J7_9GAMM|nr:3-oxo-tetronate kinase [Pseudomonas seleniipraecipitans]UUD63708.1 four-carbon acid sugar kinase family protein [Pseudomonas seleniipraecipitans]